MVSGNPLDYLDSRSLRESLRNECDGMCEKCPRARVCGFSRAEKLRGSGYLDSGDNEFNARLLKSVAYSHRYKPRTERDFSNPIGSYSSSGDYGGVRGESSGFHGSYDANGGDYSKALPKSGKSNYVKNGSCGR